MDRTTVFGLDVRAAVPFSFLEPAAAPATGREVTVTVEPGERPPWPAEARLISDERLPGGGVNFQIHHDEAGGYRIEGPAYGETIVAADGRLVWGDPGAAGLDAWQRLLVAQALPFAAVLQGLEVFHAAGVATGSGAVAITGASGAGKTSLALALERAGAELLADDVLVFEADEAGDVVVHPGAPIAAVAHAEVERLRERGHPERGELLAVNEREEVRRAEPASRPSPLRAFLFLDRRPDGPATPRFEPEPDPAQLLAATFNLLVASPARLATQLDVCARIGALRVERLTCGTDVRPGLLAEAIEERLGAAA